MHPTDQETIERYREELAEIETRRKVILRVLKALRAKPGQPGRRLTIQTTSSTGSVGGPLVKPTGAVFVQSQPVTLLDAAEKALRSAGAPLAMPDLIKLIQSMGYRKDEDPKRLRNTLAPALKRRHTQGKTFANKEGKYVLLEWEKDG